MSNQDNKMASWLKFIILGVGAAGALYGAVKLLMGQQETPHESSSCPRSNSTRRRRSLGREVPQLRECTICSRPTEEFQFLTFLPCMHNDTCLECGERIMKCMTCKRPIAERVSSDGKTIPYKPHSDDMLCTICCEYKKDIIFNCGHTVCKSCSDKLTECPMCRETITSKKPFY